MTTKTNNRETIVMSDTGPVTIDPEQWQTVASVRDGSGLANTDVGVRVLRRGGDLLVYGWRNADAARPTRAGYLIEPESIGSGHKPNWPAVVRAIRRVAGAISAPSLGSAAIADLPPREL